MHLSPSFPFSPTEPSRGGDGEPVAIVEDVGEDEPALTVEEGRDVE